MSSRENHWRGLADHHTVALPNALRGALNGHHLHHPAGRHPLFEAMTHNRDVSCCVLRASLELGVGQPETWRPRRVATLELRKDGQSWRK